MSGCHQIRKQLIAAIFAVIYLVGVAIAHAQSSPNASFYGGRTANGSSNSGWSARLASAREYVPAGTQTRPVDDQPAIRTSEPADGQPADATGANNREDTGGPWQNDMPDSFSDGSWTTRNDFAPGYAVGNRACCPDSRVWFRSEYLMWWNKSAEVPALATTSPDGTPQAQAGVLGQTGTEVLFSNGGVNPGSRSGGRFNLGYWFCPSCQEDGIEASYLFLAYRAVGLDEASQGSPILAQPFFNTQTGLQDSLVVAYPGVNTGSLNIAVASTLHSSDLVWRHSMVREECYRLDFLAGYRNAGFNESVTSATSTIIYGDTQGLVPTGTMINATDRFSARNDFNGGELGVSTQTNSGPWTLNLLAKVALGNTRSRVNVDGTTVTAVPQQAVVTNTGGLYALPTNIGNYTQNHISVLPELGATLDYRLTGRLKVSFGYTFLYWSRVARPGNLIDPNINPTQIPPGQLTGMPAPQFKFLPTDFWAQGLNVGLEYRF